ncbi:BlaI/MecI/CopY family transcriptional regulator [Pseudoruegeria sp. SHC-113]|uniref:BlaI/MecI/CopY family transcriptional regulator n=1 Tax=Pseudoruegeria sp. SHC-113 TaxID=2855439 RepID=UPI0021BB91AE|nr:BlaI/MecI/CopY family transcriptional regulator [Pseudoruegeria sp. SHC-113]MCT8158754.1 BlaI/MecI/CopY family transcriptional regulator [Pseudoruegeria sp. SHC-113]
MRKKKNSEFLTEVELEFMSELWELGEGSVRDVLERLAPERNLAYTSGATILRILEKKGFVKSTKQGKTFIYEPILTKDAYQSKSLKNLSEKLFDDTPASLVARLVDDFELSDDDFEELRALLDRRMKDGSGPSGL